MPAPSRAGSLPQCSVFRRSPVGAGLLAKAECQSPSMVNEQASSRASPLPQGICVGSRFCGRLQSSVGASLLAKAGCQSALNLDVPAPSRASPLPQGICVGSRFCGRLQSSVGASLLAKARCQSALNLDVPEPSRASFAPAVFEECCPYERNTPIARRYFSTRSRSSHDGCAILDRSLFSSRSASLTTRPIGFSAARSTNAS
ncbi:hypothetical protein FX983_06241 [Pseudomonas frederiksbergensis]|uniref:Uncharacterized protein n=1 Tax=Pseudomonas frederiksbergensis TaxID=104087 RepID=A0A6L5BSK8_9PSED|nr:hypothetical protein FX983_06241 [Pseudomonas frederiksbergensis]